MAGLQAASPAQARRWHYAASSLIIAPRLHGGPVVLRPGRATPCLFSVLYCSWSKLLNASASIVRELKKDTWITDSHRAVGFILFDVLTDGLLWERTGPCQMSVPRRLPVAHVSSVCMYVCLSVCRRVLLRWAWHHMVEIRCWDSGTTSSVTGLWSWRTRLRATQSATANRCVTVSHAIQV